MKLGFILTLLLTSTILAATTIEGKVVEVIDGNTIKVKSADEVLEIMLTGIDCPELTQEFGEESKKFTSKLLLKKKVTVELTGKDRWSNRLGIVLLTDGTNANLEIVKKGFAWKSIANHLKEDITPFLKEAKNSKIGLWQQDNPTPPWVFRRNQSMTVAKGLK